MKRLVVSSFLVLSGVFLWWGLSNVARFSLKKWDAKFDSVLQHSLTQLGLENKDVVSSVNEVKKDANGEYVLRHLTVKKVPPSKVAELTNSLEDAGASVRTERKGPNVYLKVHRGARLYQEITLLPK